MGAAPTHVQPEEIKNTIIKMPNLVQEFLPDVKLSKSLPCYKVTDGSDFKELKLNYKTSVCPFRAT